MAARSMRMAVVGGGIAGLAAAWELSVSGVDVTLFEPSRLGGMILTSRFGERPVDEGPDAFLTRVPEAVELCCELGLDGDLVAPGAGGSALWWDGRLRPLPPGLVLGIPKDLGALFRSGIISPLGGARAALDLVIPRRRPVAGSTVRELVADRLGAQVADRLVDPLVGGIHAGWIGALGAHEVTPQIFGAAQGSRSLVLGLRKMVPSVAPGPMFLAPQGGMSQLVDQLVSRLDARGVRIERRPVTSVRSLSGSRLAVDEHDETFDGAVMAVSSREASRILDVDDSIPDLKAVPRASVALVTVGTESEMPSGLNGFLVPRSAGHLMTACSFGSNKWPHWTGSSGSVVRLSSGRYGDTRAFDLDDDRLVTRLTDELGAALGRPVPIHTARVSRWPDSFPQYGPGHLDRIEASERALAGIHPKVTLAGSSYRGSGIPACIGSARRAARLLVERSPQFSGTA